MTQAVEVSSTHAHEDHSTRKSRWLWPLGLIATGIAGAAVIAFRGCWHRKMSWPVRVQGQSYQVCRGCGNKRLLEEQAFQSYGPFSYDLNQLIDWDRNQRRSAAAAVHPIERHAS